MREPDATHDGRLAFANFALDTRTGELRRAVRPAGGEVADRHPALRYLGADERLESLHADARFAGVAQRLGLRLQGGLLLPAGD